MNAQTKLDRQQLTQQLGALVSRMTGAPRQTEELKAALRRARGALRSTLASDRELKEHIDSVTKAITGVTA